MAKPPDFYDPDRVGTLFYPDKYAIAEAAASANLSPVSDDEPNLHLLLIDMQVDFCHADGSLYVPGAEDDIRRTIDFIYRNAECITQITCSLDSHVPQQIFSPNWWTDAEGQHPEPYTVVSAKDIADGRWTPTQMPEWSKKYVQELERQAKKELVIWPYHVLIGSMGHALDPELWSAVAWHSLARKVEPRWVMKGSIPETEHYSVIQPEIDVPHRSGSTRNQALLDELAAADSVYIAGEAESHCVLETVEDIVNEFSPQSSLLEKVHLLQDCTSPVVHPEVDFHAIAQEALTGFADQGLQLVDSTEPVCT
jgi:nicotinamidase/pyrazinamidase